MSKKYKQAMDKIVLSNELKTKIIENAAKSHLPLTKKAKRAKIFYIRYGAGVAACLLLCFLAVFVSQNFADTDNVPSVTNDPGYDSPVPEPTGAVNPELPKSDALPEINSIENQQPDEDVAQNTVNHHIAAETQKPQNETPHIATPPETQAPGNHAPVSSENSSANEVNPPEPSPGGEDNQVASPINPSIDAESFSDVREQLGYAFKVPQYLPEGYELDAVSLLFGSLVQLSYLSENDEIVYRTERTVADISGDYTVYDEEETEKINKLNTTLKSSNDVFYGAVWNDGDMSYSLNSANGIDKDTMVKIVESIDYPDGQAGGVPEESMTDNKNSMGQYDGNTSDSPPAESFNEKENDEAPEQIDIMDNRN